MDQRMQARSEIINKLSFVKKAKYGNRRNSFPNNNKLGVEQSASCTLFLQLVHEVIKRLVHLIVRIFHRRK